MDLRRLPPSSLGAGVLVLALVLINSLAVWGIVSARRDARSAAVRDLELRTLAQARSLEASLASLRADLIFLSRSPPLVALVDAASQGDPLVRRWSRLDAEGTVLLFLEAHPPIEHFVVRSGAEILLRAGRQDEAPLLLPPAAGDPSSAEWAAARWPLGSSGAAELKAWVDPRALLPPFAAPSAQVVLVIDAPPSETASGVGSRVAGPGSFDAPAVDAIRGLAASIPVTDEGWDPPLRWRLVRREEEGDLARSLETLAGHFGATVALNLAVMASSGALGWVAFRNLRRSARFEAEREQQARVSELERQVLHTERLASVGRLAAGFAHEMNNPLEGIANYLSLLREELDGGRAHEARSLVDRASEGVVRAAGVIRQILAFSEAGSPEKEILDLRGVLDAAADFVRANPRYRGADLALVLGSSPLLVRGNATTLGQLTLNLLLNALDAEPAAGPVELEATVEEGVVVMEVRDRGPGLAEEVRDRLFEPFTSTRGSTGLGLAVCRGIVEDHGGRIEARDREGGGAAFAVRLPEARGEAGGSPVGARETVE
ncbi:MAG TPA: HAMP domain-containing sensor histidine kinase [Thermoanaerobaculia bacterium]|nr:HAMP domain-containing sensor histidine kinase [Thermoanaerobaculia bacterium]